MQKNHFVLNKHKPRGGVQIILQEENQTNFMILKIKLFKSTIFYLEHNKILSWYDKLISKWGFS